VEVGFCLSTINADFNEFKRSKHVPGPLRPSFADAAGPILHRSAQTYLGKAIEALIRGL